MQARKSRSEEEREGNRSPIDERDGTTREDADPQPAPSPLSTIAQLADSLPPDTAHKLFRYCEDVKDFTNEVLELDMNALLAEAAVIDSAREHEQDLDRHWEVRLTMEGDQGLLAKMRERVEEHERETGMVLPPFENEVKVLRQLPQSTKNFMDVLFWTIGLHEGATVEMHFPCVGVEALRTFLMRATEHFEKDLRVSLVTSITELFHVQPATFKAAEQYVDDLPGNGSFRSAFFGELDCHQCQHEKVVIVSHVNGLTFIFFLSLNFTTSGTGLRVYFAKTLEEALNVPKSKETVAIFVCDLRKRDGPGADVLNTHFQQYRLERENHNFIYLTERLMDVYSGLEDLPEEQPDDEHLEREYADRLRRKLASPAHTKSPTAAEANLLNRQRIAFLSAATPTGGPQKLVVENQKLVSAKERDKFQATANTLGRIQKNLAVKKPRKKGLSASAKRKVRDTVQDEMGLSENEANKRLKRPPALDPARQSYSNVPRPRTTGAPAYGGASGSGSHTSGSASCAGANSKRASGGGGNGAGESGAAAARAITGQTDAGGSGAAAAHATAGQADAGGGSGKDWYSGKGLVCAKCGAKKSWGPYRAKDGMTYCGSCYAAERRKLVPANLRDDPNVPTQAIIWFLVMLKLGNHRIKLRPTAIERITDAGYTVASVAKWVEDDKPTLTANYREELKQI